jgi:magnesium transporter
MKHVCTWEISKVGVCSIVYQVTNGYITDHVITLTQNIVHYEKTLARAHSNYLAQISIEITQSSNRTNDLATRMTALASILLPLNVITGLWGMNVKVPGQEVDSLTWFFGICGAMALFAVGTFVFVRKFYSLL